MSESSNPIDYLMRYVIRAPGFQEPIAYSELAKTASRSGLFRKVYFDIDHWDVPEQCDFHREIIVGDRVLVVRGTISGKLHPGHTDTGFVMTESSLFIELPDGTLRYLLIEVSPAVESFVWLPPVFVQDGSFIITCQDEQWKGISADLVDLMIDALKRCSEGENHKMWLAGSSLLRLHFISNGKFQNEFCEDFNNVRLPALERREEKGNRTVIHRYEWDKDLYQACWEEAMKVVTTSFPKVQVRS